MSNLFCPSIGCDNLALFGSEITGHWCRACWENLNALLGQKLARDGYLSPREQAIYTTWQADQAARKQEARA